MSAKFPRGGGGEQDLFQPEVHIVKMPFQLATMSMTAIMSPQPKVGDILFLVRIPSASVSASVKLLSDAISFEPVDGF